MNSENLKDLKEKEPLKLWKLCNTLLLNKTVNPLRPEYECFLIKRGKFFKNTYHFFFYKDFIVTSKVVKFI